MEETTIREKIFKKMRNALLEKNDNPFRDTEGDFSIYPSFKETDELTFAQEFTKLGGKFAYCEDTSDLAEKIKYIVHENKGKKIFLFEETLKPLMEEFEIDFSDDPKNLTNPALAITYCEMLVARTGSILVSSRQLSGRRLIAFPDVHVVVAFTNQISDHLKVAFERLKVKYNNKLPSTITMISGASRTADIEKTLVMGAHGPKELYLLLVEAET
jgi:L-lactate dehydrogenase complex protein LldG